MKLRLLICALGLLSLPTLAASIFAQGIPTEALLTHNLHGELVLALSKQRFVVQRPGAEPVTLPEATALVTAFEGLGDGWLAAGLTNTAPRQTGLLLVTGDGAAARQLATPTTTRLVFDAALDVAGDRLRGLAWLEGERLDQLEVRAARFDGERWSAPVVVAPKGPGSQVGLTSAVLGDGSWLLVWSANDGHDDELLWSRLADGAWSAPRPLAADNQVPDVGPTLGVLAGGPVVAWSRYDGNHYRVTMARFDGESWSEPEVVGPPGSLSPTFMKTQGAAFLLYQTALPRGWTIAELDGQGKSLRTASTNAFRLERPLIEKLTSEGIELRWPGEIGRKTAQATWQPAPPATQ